MKLIRNAFAASLVAAVTVAGCSSQHGQQTTATNAPGASNSVGTNYGAAGLHLQIAPGVTFTSLSYTITNGGTTLVPSTVVPIADAQSIEFVVGQLPAGGPYTININATDSNADPCSGTATFSIMAGMTTAIVMNITCTAPADASANAVVTTGNLAVDAGVVYTSQGAYQCPGISGLSASPAEVVSPQTAQVGVDTVVSATPDGGAIGTPTINWTASAGTFVNTNSNTSSLASPVFNCGSFVGTAILNVTIGLTGSNNGADAGDVCANALYQTGSLQIVCDGGGTLNCFGQTPCPAAPATPTYCATLTNDPMNCGACGTTCTAPATSCVSGACACPTAGQTVCGTGAAAGCFSTQTDPNHCGTSCTVCAAGDTCQAGVCSAPPPQACVNAATDAANCVKCTGNSSGECTPTEAAIVNLQDIARNHLTAVPLSGNSCYACLVNAGAIDDTVNGDSNQECGDLPAGSFATPDAGSVSSAQACLNVLNCIFPSNCQNASASDPGATDGISNCFCGAAYPNTTACNAGTQTGANGSCAALELDGFAATSTTSNSTITGEFTTDNTPAGMANSILSRAGSNQSPFICPACFN